MKLKLGLLATAALWTGYAAAAPVNYVVESNHTYPSFEAPHMGISWWRGKFDKTTGSVVLDEAAKTGSVDITIDTTSVDFGHEKMNEHAKGEEFFNTAKYPTATYKGKIVYKDGTPSEVDGQFTLLGVTKPLKLEIDSFKCIQHPFFKKEVCGADAEAEFNRADFGMSKYADGDAGKVKLRIQVEAIKN
jgi:polyisoprenoid-binding protein YceI